MYVSAVVRAPAIIVLVESADSDEADVRSSRDARFDRTSRSIISKGRYLFAAVFECDAGALSVGASLSSPFPAFPSTALLSLSSPLLPPLLPLVDALFICCTLGSGVGYNHGAPSQ